MKRAAHTTWRAETRIGCSELAAYHARRRGLLLSVRVKNPLYGDRVDAAVDRREPKTGARVEVAFRAWDLGPLHTTVAAAQAWCEREADREADLRGSIGGSHG